MKPYTTFLLLSLILSLGVFTARAQSEIFEIQPETKTIPVTTYGLLVQDAVQKRVLENMAVSMQERINELESIQAQTEHNLTRQITILSAENQALEMQLAASESKFAILEKERRKKQRGITWLKIAVGGAFVLGVFAGK